MIVGTTVPHYHPTKIFILSYTLVTIYIPVICINILTINIFNCIHQIELSSHLSPELTIYPASSRLNYLFSLFQTQPFIHPQIELIIYLPLTISNCPSPSDLTCINLLPVSTISQPLTPYPP